LILELARPHDWTPKLTYEVEIEDNNRLINKQK
jgi:hypothetical protein